MPHLYTDEYWERPWVDMRSLSERIADAQAERAASEAAREARLTPAEVARREHVQARHDRIIAAAVEAGPSLRQDRLCRLARLQALLFTGPPWGGAPPLSIEEALAQEPRLSR